MIVFSLEKLQQLSTLYPHALHMLRCDVVN